MCFKCLKINRMENSSFWNYNRKQNHSGLTTTLFNEDLFLNLDHIKLLQLVMTWFGVYVTVCKAICYWRKTEYLHTAQNQYNGVNILDLHQMLHGLQEVTATSRLQPHYPFFGLIDSKYKQTLEHYYCCRHPVWRWTTKVNKTEKQKLLCFVSCHMICYTNFDDCYTIVKNLVLAANKF